MNVWVLFLVLVVGFGCTESSSGGSSSCEAVGSCSAMGDAMLPMTESTDASDMSDEAEVVGSDATLADEEGESASDDAGGSDDEDPNIDTDSAAMDDEQDLGTDEPVMENAFVQVSAGGYHSCARRGTGEVECWGRNNHGQVDVPTQSI